MTKYFFLVIGCFSSALLVGQEVYFSEGNKAVLTTNSVSSEKGTSTIEFDFAIPKLSINRGEGGFDSVVIPGLEPMQKTGAPALSETGFIFAVPDGVTPKLKMDLNEIEVMESVLVMPKQKKFRCKSDREVFAFDSKLYSSGGIYPREAIQIEDIGRFRGVRLVRLGIRPAQTDFRNQTLIVTKRLKGKIQLMGGDGPTPSVQLTNGVLQFIKSIAVNASDFISNSGIAQRPEKMLIISADVYENALQPFIQWKKEKGLHVDLVTFSAAGGSKEAVKKYIQNYYNNRKRGKPTYLLFVGNKITMPGFMESTASGQAASDYRYALLEGNDAIPDVFYGRFLADSKDELETQIRRSIEYEKSGFTSASWETSAMTIASNEGSNPSDKEYAIQVQEGLKTGSYKKFDNFFQADMNATSKNILRSLGEGRSWIAYFGHGSGTGWGSTNDDFGNSTVSKVSNASKLPILIDVACQNGSWVNLPSCFGKTWVTHQVGGEPAGAVGYYGGSVNISWDPPAVMSVGVAKRHFEKGIKSLGGSVLAGQMYLVEKMGTGNDVVDNLKWYNLFGDPSLTLKTNVGN